MLGSEAVKGLGKKQLLEIIEKQSAQLKKYEETAEKQAQQIVALQFKLEAERIENELLRQKVHLLLRRLYEPSSEKLSAAQPDFWQMMKYSRRMCPRERRRPLMD